MCTPERLQPPFLPGRSRDSWHSGFWLDAGPPWPAAKPAPSLRARGPVPHGTLLRAFLLGPASADRLACGPGAGTGPVGEVGPVAGVLCVLPEGSLAHQPHFPRGSLGSGSGRFSSSSYKVHPGHVLKCALNLTPISYGKSIDSKAPHGECSPGVIVTACTPRDQLPGEGAEREPTPESPLRPLPTALPFQEPLCWPHHHTALLFDLGLYGHGVI